MLIIQSGKDIKKLREGDSYVIDTFTSFKEESQEVTQNMLDDREKLEDLVVEHLANLADPEKDKKNNARRHR